MTLTYNGADVYPLPTISASASGVSQITPAQFDPGAPFPLLNGTVWNYNWVEVNSAGQVVQQSTNGEVVKVTSNATFPPSKDPTHVVWPSPSVLCDLNETNADPPIYAYDSLTAQAASFEDPAYQPSDDVYISTQKSNGETQVLAYGIAWAQNGEWQQRAYSSPQAIDQQPRPTSVFTLTPSLSESYFTAFSGWDTFAPSQSGGNYSGVANGNPLNYPASAPTLTYHGVVSVPSNCFLGAGIPTQASWFTSNESVNYGGTQPAQFTTDYYVVRGIGPVCAYQYPIYAGLQSYTL